jgi:hypothetical protein
MNILSTASAAGASPVLSAPASGHVDRAEAILRAAGHLLPSLESSRPIGTNALRTIMTTSFGGTDAEGFRIWKDAYEALEAAQVLCLKKFCPAIISSFYAEIAQASLALNEFSAMRADLLGLLFPRMPTFRHDAAGGKSERGDITASQQGRAGLRLQHALCDATVPQLKALGLIFEIFSWKLRLFVPTSIEGPAILARLFERHALVAVTDRAAAI